MSRKSNASAERTAMSHAERILMGEGWVFQSVRKVRANVSPMGVPPRWVNVSEDLFGVFDVVAVTTARAGIAPLFLQVTTFSDTRQANNATARMRKIEDWVAGTLWGMEPAAYLEVWAWEARRGMHGWRYQHHWLDREGQRPWHELPFRALPSRAAA